MMATTTSARAFSSIAQPLLLFSLPTLSLILGCVEPISFTPTPPTVPALRLPMNNAYLGSVHSSDLRPKFVWEPSTAKSDGDIRYELQLSTNRDFEGEKIEQTLFETEFRPTAALPVSFVAPVGARYFWHVRACLGTSCSDYSRTWYANVGRVTNDYNCDGYSDIAVGATGEDSIVMNGGRVRVYFGDQGYFSDTMVDGLLGGYGEFHENGFAGGNVRTAGDVNGDGCADLIFGVPPTASRSKGYAYLFVGAPGTTFDGLVDTALASNQVSDGFGEEVGGAGDLNGDAFDDFYVLYRDGVQRGRVDIYLGQSGDRIDVVPDAILSIDGFFSEVRSAGDINGDGAADIVAGYPGYSIDGIVTGAAFLYLGSFEGRLDAEIDTILVGRSYDDFFGETVASAGDLNNDGFSDVLVGNARTEDSGRGRPGNVDIFYGGAGEFERFPNATLSGTIGNDYFGRSMQSVGDVNGDECGDILIGAPHTQINGQFSAGRAYLYWGNCDASFDEVADVIIENSAAKPRGGDYFGLSVASGDFNADGIMDLVIGAPEDFEGSGRIEIYAGTKNWPFDSVPHTVLHGVSPDDTFGSGLADL